MARDVRLILQRQTPRTLGRTVLPLRRAFRLAPTVGAMRGSLSADGDWEIPQDWLRKDEPSMDRSKWTIPVVVLIVVGVVIVKHTRHSSESPEPAVVAPVATEGEARAPAFEGAEPDAAAPPGPAEAKGDIASQSGSSPSSLPAKPATEGAAPEQQQTRAEPRASGGARLVPQSEPPAGSPTEENGTATPIAEGPLSGSKLNDCLASGLPTMADFGLGTCKACQAMEPILKQAVQDYQGRANILFVELDKYPDLAREYRIAVMPTQIFFDGEGKQVGSHMGYMDRAEIDRRLAAAGARQ